MKIFIICSTSFYNKVKEVKEKLEEKGYVVETPNCYDEDESFNDYDKMSEEEYLEYFKNMYNKSRENIKNVDAVLALNYTKEKNGEKLENYIGASTFLELYEAFMQNKKIFILNDLPNNLLYDELKGFNPTIIHGDLNIIK